MRMNKATKMFLTESMAASKHSCHFFFTTVIATITAHMNAMGAASIAFSPVIINTARMITGTNLTKAFKKFI